MKRFPKKFVFILCYISYVSIYAARLNLSMASPELITKDILTSEQYGFWEAHSLRCMPVGDCSTV